MVDLLLRHYSIALSISKYDISTSSIVIFGGSFLVNFHIPNGTKKTEQILNLSYKPSIS